ncbi:MAG: hypothetical protein KDA93_06565 [Planctomycetaceae bacterium]|nr:hypothetical protein [Planctomycetaceae bacterium]
MKPAPLVEHVADWHSQLQVDRTKRLVRNVALTGDTSRNGYHYQEQALRDAVALYDQRPVFLDHAADKSRPQERSTRDLVGSIVNPRYESGRIRGDIRVLDTDSGRTFLALSDSDAPGVGMSHVVLAERAGDDGSVSRIHDVVSVDAVVFPATTTTFRESIEGTDEPAQEVLSVQEPQTTSPSNMEEQLQQLIIERDELLARLDEIQSQQDAAQQEQVIEDLISESGLPSYAVTETFRQQLLRASESQQRELLRERLTLIDASRSFPPLSRERSATSHKATSDNAFVAMIKRQPS